jgi:acetylornithine deacetylase/succinyl-diaminopimelate desuccinylase-like protein
VPSQNIRVLFDGEEERGSPSMPAVLSRYRDKLAGDLLLVCDGPRHPTGRPTLVFGAVGFLVLDLTVYGPQVALHAGHFGNWAPNPAMRLARLLASMKDDDGKVLIEGFADGMKPLTPEDEALLAAVPDDPAVLMRRFGFAAPERPDTSLQQAIQQPSLNIRGLACDLVGAASRGVVPERAVASLDVRLPMGLTSAMMTDRIRAHIVKQGFHIVAEDPGGEERATYPRLVKLETRDLGTPFLTSPEAPAAKRLAGALTRALGGELIRIRTFGSWLQLGPLIESMGSPEISICTVDYDNNQHGDNENLRLGHFFEAIEAFVSVLTM